MATGPTSTTKETVLARIEELKSQARQLVVLTDYRNSQIKRYEQDLAEINDDIAKIQKKLDMIPNAIVFKEDKENLESLRRNIDSKMNDGSKFYAKLAELSDSIGNFEEIFDIFAELSWQVSTFNEYYDSYIHVIQRAENEPDPDRKAQLIEDSQTYRTELDKTNSATNEAYGNLIDFPATRVIYEEYAKEDVTTLVSLEEKEDGKIQKATALANSRENVDRAKMLIYIDDYLKTAESGQPVTAPKFTRLSEYYDPETGDVPAEKFPAFFKSLTGVDISLYEQENELKAGLLRQEITKRGIKDLNQKEKDQLRKELGQKPEEEQEEGERSILSYMSLKEEEEYDALDKKQKVKATAKKLLSKADRLTDPHLGDEVTQQRAVQVHDAFTKLGSGKLNGILDLTRLPEKENLRVDFLGIVRDHVSDQVMLYHGDVKKQLSDAISDRVDKSRVGRAVKTKKYQVSTFITDKSTVVKKYKKKAKDKGDGLLKFLIKKLLKESIEKVVDVTKNVIKIAKKTQLAGRVGGWFNSSSIGQKIQAAGTATLKLAKAVIKLPAEFKDGLLMRYNKVYSVVDGKILQPVIKPIVRLGMDMGYVGKTILKKAPYGLIYGGGSAALALALGVPTAALLPVFIGGGALGVGLEVVDSIMNTPTTRTLIRPLRWLQEQGSALYKDPISGRFSNEIIKNNPSLAERLSSTGNALGTRFGNIFSSVKTGLSAAMIAAVVASVLGINPFIAAGATFVTVASAKLFMRTTTGQRYATQLADGNFGKIASKFGNLPFMRILYQVQNTAIVNRLVQDLVENFKQNPRTALSSFRKDNFSFSETSGFMSAFQTFNNYIGLLGYTSGLSFINRFFFSSLLTKFLPVGMEQFAGMGLREILRNAGGMGLFSKLMVGARIAFLPGIVAAAGSITALAIAAALGIPITGLFATIGATVGGILGFGVGALFAGSTFGAAAPLIFVTSGIGTLLGTWIGSLFDKVAENTIGTLFGIVGSIGALFTLIDLAYNGKSLRKMATLSISLALTMPTIGGIIEKASQGQSQADPTIPSPTATALRDQTDIQYIGKVKVINKTYEKIAFNQLDTLSNTLQAISQSEQIFLVISNSQLPSAYVNNQYLVVTLSSKDGRLEEQLKEALSEVNISTDKLSQSN
jgi:hypothetical protein